MEVTKELKRIAKSADYFFIHVDGHKAILELMKSRDVRGDFNPSHVASYEDIDCQVNDYSRRQFNGKARIFVSDYEARTLLSLIQILHNGTQVTLEINLHANCQIYDELYLVRDSITLFASRNNKRIGTFTVFESVGYDNTARHVRFI